MSIDDIGSSDARLCASVSVGMTISDSDGSNSSGDDLCQPAIADGSSGQSSRDNCSWLMCMATMFSISMLLLLTKTEEDKGADDYTNNTAVLYAYACTATRNNGDHDLNNSKKDLYQSFSAKSATLIF